MKYNLSIKDDINKVKLYINDLVKKGSKIEVKELREKRTISQNAYLHVCLTIFALETGYTLEEIKVVLKRDYGLYYEKNGKKFLKSTSKMDTKEMTDFIEYIRTKAGIEGIYIPDADEYKCNWVYFDNLRAL